MDHRLPKVGLAISLVCALAAAITFVFLNLAFEGPSPVKVFGAGYTLEATFKQTEVLPTKQPVLEKGIEVGKVKDVEFNKDDSTATVTFSIDEEYAPLNADATVAIGERTILGDSYLRLDRGTDGAGELAAGGEVRSIPSVDFDEALDFFDEDGRDDVRSILNEINHSTRSPDGGARLSATTGELSRTVSELRDVTRTLRGQDDELAGLVRDSSLVLDELGSRERSLRAISGAGRTTLDALAANTAALDQGLAETPGVLDASRRLLAGSRPLLEIAGPMVRELRRAAPDLKPVIAELPSISADTIEVVAGLSAIPSFGKVLELIELIGPAVPGMEAAARNLVPLLRYTNARGKGIASFFANMASVNAHGDDAGRWARFSILLEQGELANVPTPSNCAPEDDVEQNFGFCHNAYPKPGDAADPEPYEEGSYPSPRAIRPEGPWGVSRSGYSRLPRDERRRQILDAARRHFGEGYYSGVSTAEIAEAAGVSPGLVHHYFGSKRELYLEVVREMLRVPPLPPPGEIERPVAGGGDRRERRSVARPGQGEPGDLDGVDGRRGIRPRPRPRGALRGGPRGSGGAGDPDARPRHAR